MLVFTIDIAGGSLAASRSKLLFYYELDRGLDFRAVEPEAEREYLAARREMALAGVGSDGLPLDPVLASTIRRRRRKPGYDPTGPPLAPRHDGSRIANPDLAFAYPAPGTARIVASWPTMPFLRDHELGIPGRMAARPVVRTYPAGRVRVVSLYADHVHRTLVNPQDYVFTRAAASPAATAAESSVFSRLYGRTG